VLKGPEENGFRNFYYDPTIGKRRKKGFSNGVVLQPPLFKKKKVTESYVLQ